MSEPVEHDEYGQLLQATGCCGCGMPDEHLRFVHQVLEHMAKRHADEYKGDAWEKWWLEFDAITGSRTATYFVAYWLDQRGYTEHGGSVPGWLDHPGEDLLARLREYHARLDAETVT